MTACSAQQHEFHVGDCIDIVPTLPEFDLVFGSPPYEAARTYGMGFSLRGDAWVQWAADRFEACYNNCRGLTAWVVEGQTRNFRWSATPALLMAELHRRGVRLRKPPAFCRVGIPGSGGPDYLRNDWEFVICASKGKLPWSDNTAMGKPPKYAPGGRMSHRTRSGGRVNGKMLSIARLTTEPKVASAIEGSATSLKLHTKRSATRQTVQAYTPPQKANPGNLIECVVGGGRMGHRLCHENEAPFPESLAEFFIRSFCPPGGRVLDPFSGSGTTVCVAKKHGRFGVGIELRSEQVELSERRIQDERYDHHPGDRNSSVPEHSVGCESDRSVQERGCCRGGCGD